MMHSKWLTGYVLVLLAQLAVAQIPQTISYQGVLTDGAVNLLDGSYTLRFKLYDVATLGTALGTPEWSEDHTVTVTDGIFSVILGSITTFSSSTVYFTAPYWLEISIVDGATVTTLAPRVELTSAPYANRSRGVAGSNIAFHPGPSPALGIGTASPSTQLEVEGPSDAAVIVKIDQIGIDNYVGLNLERDDAEKWHIGMNDQNDYLRFRRTASSDDMVIDASGNVGIGTTTPDAKLEVYADVATADPLLELQQVNISGDASMRFVTTGNTFSMGVDDSDGDKFKISNWATLGTADGFIIDGTTGYVGIGATTPTAKLEVAGDVKANSVILPATTRNYAIPAPEFALLNGTRNIDSLSYYAYSTWGDTRLTAAVHLPHDANMTGFQARVEDEYGDGPDSVSFTIDLWQLTAGSAPVSLTSVGTTGSLVGVQTLAASFNQQVDNQNSTYLVTVIWKAPPYPDYTKLKLYDIRITYTVTSPLP